MKDYLIQKLNIECPLCDTTHQVEERKRAAKVKIKGEIVDFEELGMEAVRKIEVENFPAFIIVDDKGNDFFELI